MIIAVFNQKGGVGKTTTCLSIAAALARKGYQPLAIDLDPQCNLSMGLGGTVADSRDSAFAFYQGERALGELVRETSAGVGLVPAHAEMAKIDALHGKSARITSRLKEGIAALTDAHPGPILIDCCPMLGVLSLNALFAADRVLMPVSADYLSMQGAHRLDAALDVLEKPFQRKIERRVVLTRFDGRRKYSHAVLEQLQARYGRVLCRARIRETVALAEAPAHGQDIFRFAPGSPGAQDYAALAEELIGENFLV